jgi:hypothetical protein
MSRIDAIQKRKDQNGEYERFAAEEAFLRSQIRTLAIEASKLKRKKLDLRAENGSNAPLEHLFNDRCSGTPRAPSASGRAKPTASSRVKTKISLTGFDVNRTLPIVTVVDVRVVSCPLLGVLSGCQTMKVALTPNGFRADHLSIEGPLIDGWRSMKCF